MSTVPDAGEIAMYQGEDWSATLTFEDADAPTEAELGAYDVVMEIRTKNNAQTLLTRIEMGSGISVVAGAAKSTLLLEIAKEVTREIDPGTYVTDLFVSPPAAGTYPMFAGTVKVTRRRTIEEGVI